MKNFLLQGGIILFTLSSIAQSNPPDSRKSKEANWVAASASKPTTQRARIFQHRWKLIEVYDKPVPATTDRQRDAFIHFKESSNRVTGMGGCNRFSGRYHINLNEQLQVDAVVATRMYCGDNNPEAAFFEALKNLRRFDVVGDQLLFFDEAGTRIAVFEPLLTNP